jgi:hypothetical protein
MGIRVVVLLAVLGVLAGCDDDIDLTGTYEVSLSVGGEPCGNDQPVESTPPYLKFYKMEFFGQEYFAYDGCTDAAATECTNIGGLFNGFYEPNDTGWSGEQTFSFGGNSCTLGYSRQDATLTGKDLVIDSATYSEEAALEGEACSVEAAKQRNTDMPCVQHARIDAVKIE